MRHKEREIAAVIPNAQNGLENEKEQNWQGDKHEAKNFFAALAALLLQFLQMRLHELAIKPKFFGNFMVNSQFCQSLNLFLLGSSQLGHNKYRWVNQ